MGVSRPPDEFGINGSMAGNICDVGMLSTTNNNKNISKVRYNIINLNDDFNCLSIDIKSRIFYDAAVLLLHSLITVKSCRRPNKPSFNISIIRSV